MTGPVSPSADWRPVVPHDPPTVEYLSDHERRVLAAYRALRKSGKVGIILVQWNGLTTQVLQALPAEVIA